MWILGLKGLNSIVLTGPVINPNIGPLDTKNV